MLPVFEILAAEPTDEEQNKVLALLLDFNALHTAHVIDRPHLGIVLKDPNTSEIIGGLYAVDEYNWLFIKYVIVPSALRGKGFGTKLMNEAERIARERAYVGIFLDTFDFQAKPFYLKLGFEQFGELEGDEQTPRRFFLKKVFSSERGHANPTWAGLAWLPHKDWPFGSARIYFECKFNESRFSHFVPVES